VTVGDVTVGRRPSDVHPPLHPKPFQLAAFVVVGFATGVAIGKHLHTR
jgi:hypothetical protein